MAFDENDVARMALKGRAPSYDSRGNIRGFRSRPGAPQADPTQNIGALGSQPSSKTPDAIWDQAFRNSITGKTPSDLRLERQTPSYPSQAQINGLDDDDPITKAINSILNPPSQQMTPSLETMSQGGMNSAQKWSQPRWTQTQGQFGSMKSVRSPFGWGSAFTPNG